MAVRSICGVLEALDALSHADGPQVAMQAVFDATVCAAAADGVLITSLSGGVPEAAWNWPRDFLPGAQQKTLEEITAAHPYPLVTHTRTGPGWALRLSDILSGRQYRATPLYLYLLKDLSIPRQLAFKVPTVSGRALCVALGRSGHDFTDTECDQLNALRGPLGLAARRDPTPVLLPTCDHLIHSVSRRELEVLQLAATGLSDLQIGRRLGIAERTVGKHLENVYRKTNTTNRTEAAAQLRSIDLAESIQSDAFAGALRPEAARGK